MELRQFIDMCPFHGKSNIHPPSDPHKRHEWESKILYSVIDCLKDGNHILDYGCGRNATMKFSVMNRFPNMIYTGLDPKQPENAYNLDGVGDFTNLEKALEEADCIVAGSVFTHLDWDSIEMTLDSFEPVFNRGGEFGFTIFEGERYETYGRGYHKEPNTFHVSITTVEQYKTYCDSKGLAFTLLPYVYDVCHPLPGYSGDAYQSFCNIKKR